MAEDNLNPDPQNADKALEETLAELDKPETPETPETPIDETPPDDAAETPDEKPSDEKPADEEAEAGGEEELDAEQEDYKKRYSDSTREAAILAAKLKKQNEALEQAGNIPQPTEEEMRTEFPEWDEMSATEHRLATDSVWNTRRFGLIEGVSKETKDIEAWNSKVDTFTEDPKSLIAYPRLEGKIEGFKAFCAKETRRGVDFEDLVSSFLFRVDSDRKPKKGQMFERPTAGANTTPKPVNTKLSVEESAKLMETDYNKWQEMLMAGKLSAE